MIALPCSYALQRIEPGFVLASRSVRQLLQLLVSDTPVDSQSPRTNDNSPLVLYEARFICENLLSIRYIPVL